MVKHRGPLVKIKRPWIQAFFEGKLLFQKNVHSARFGLKSLMTAADAVGLSHISELLTLSNLCVLIRLSLPSSVVLL